MFMIPETIIANTLAMQTGQFGLKQVTPATSLTDLSTFNSGEYFYGIVQATTASKVTFKPRATPLGDTTLTDIQMEAGDIISGKFDLVTVSSGQVLIYLGKEAGTVY